MNEYASRASGTVTPAKEETDHVATASGGNAAASLCAAALSLAVFPPFMIVPAS